jgi:hypothetical protein
VNFDFYMGDTTEVEILIFIFGGLRDRHAVLTPNVLPPLQPVFTRRTGGHCLGTLMSRIIHTFSLLSLRL